MSRRKPGLSSPPVVAGVFLVLAALVVVNVRTFAPKRPRARAAATAGAAEVRVQAHPALPMDLEDVMRPSHSAADLEARSAGLRPAVPRDPFTAAPLEAPAPAAAPARAPARPRPAGVPACTAVMLGAAAPMALIDGRLVRVGDTVRQYVVERIDARGVTLGGAQKLYLPVGLGPAGEGSHSVVTGAAPGTRAGRGGLVEYAESERN